MFNDFEEKFDVKANNNQVGNTVYSEKIDYFISAYGGKSIADGLFKVNTFEQAKKWNANIKAMYPQIKANYVSFIFDWMCRVFAVDLNSNKIFMFDSATNEYFELDGNIDTFMNIQAIDALEDIFDQSVFKKYLFENNVTLNYEEIIGFKVPLFLNGNDDASNFEIIDSDVYWEINRQLITQSNS